MRPLAAALCLALGACTTTTTPVAVCMPITPYTAAEMQAIGVELAALPGTDPLLGLADDWVHMRDVARACQAANR